MRTMLVNFKLSKRVKMQGLKSGTSGRLGACFGRFFIACFILDHDFCPVFVVRSNDYQEGDRWDISRGYWSTEPTISRISGVFTRDRIINSGLHQGQPTTGLWCFLHMKYPVYVVTAYDIANAHATRFGIRLFPSHAVIITLLTW